jgi:hypothetical protein
VTEGGDGVVVVVVVYNLSLRNAPLIRTDRGNCSQRGKVGGYVGGGGATFFHFYLIDLVPSNRVRVTLSGDAQHPD